MTQLTKEQLLERAKHYASSRGGECLSTEYISAKTKTQWKCSNSNHPIFTADFQIAQRGTWCVLCAKEKNAKKAILTDGLERAKNHAAKKGGECLSTQYLNARTKMKWKCKAGHIWESNLDHAVNRDRWCQQCFYDKSLEQKFDVKAENYAKTKGGSVILPENRKVKTATLLTWKCKNIQHKSWTATYRNVVEKEGWCPYCAGKFSKEEYLEMAKNYANNKNKNWTCISKEYLEQSKQLIWNCKEHGDWSESYSSLVDKNGGCKKCRGKLTPEEYLQIAKKYAISKGGECLSENYIRQNEKLIWNCHKHGSWKSDYSNIVLNNRWCPICFKVEKQEKMLKKAYDYAKSLDGECLTTVFNTRNDIFEWKCNNNTHSKWNNKYASIFTNQSWCPECGIYYQKENQVRKLLEYLLGFSLEKARPQWNVNPATGNLLELDGYNKEHKIAFEYQGRQHYEQHVFKNTNQTLETIQYKDKIKAEHCIQQGITLIIVDGRKKRDTSEKIVKFLQNLLDSYNIQYKKDINLDEVEKIYNEARIEKCDNSKK